MKTLKPSVTSNAIWPVYIAGTAYSVGDIFKTVSTPTWGYWEVTVSGVGISEPSSTLEGDTVTTGTLTCKLNRIGSSSSGGSSEKGIDIWIAGKSYKKNEFASYKDTIYRCITPNSDTVFDVKKWIPQGKDEAVTYWTTGVHYSINDIVKYEGNLYSCLKNHTSTVFNDDYNADNWKMIGDDQTVVGSDGGYSQVTKIGVTAPLTVKIDIGVTNTFCKPPVEVLKKEAGTPSINEVEATFSANENTNYAANRFVTLDNSLHEITEVKYSTSLKETITSGKIYESEEIDPSDYKSISEVKV